MMKKHGDQYTRKYLIASKTPMALHLINSKKDGIPLNYNSIKKKSLSQLRQCKVHSLRNKHSQSKLGLLSGSGSRHLPMANCKAGKIYASPKVASSQGEQNICSTYCLSPKISFCLAQSKLKGTLPNRNQCAITPIEKISHFYVYFALGAGQKASGEPQGGEKPGAQTDVGVLQMAGWQLSPKSMILTCSELETMRLPGFRSKCTIPNMLIYLTPWSTMRSMKHLVTSEREFRLKMANLSRVSSLHKKSDSKSSFSQFSTVDRQYWGMKTALPPLICLRMFFSCSTLFLRLPFSLFTIMGFLINLSRVKVSSAATTQLLLPEQTYQKLAYFLLRQIVLKFDSDQYISYRCRQSLNFMQFRMQSLSFGFGGEQGLLGSCNFHRSYSRYKTESQSSASDRALAYSSDDAEYRDNVCCSWEERTACFQRILCLLCFSTSSLTLARPSASASSPSQNCTPNCFIHLLTPGGRGFTLLPGKCSPQCLYISSKMI